MAVEIIPIFTNSFHDKHVDLVDDRELQYWSLQEWTRFISEDPHLLPEFMAIFNRKIYAGSLRLDCFQGRGIIPGNYYHFFDCANSLVISDAENDSPHAASCCIGFDVVPSNEKYFSVKPVNYDVLSCDIKPGDVIISQIQSTPNLHNKHFLKGWRWEQALVSLVADWVNYEGLGNIYIWPGEELAVGNAADPQKLDAFVIRYNGTARSLGFKKNQHGLYVLAKSEYS